MEINKRQFFEILKRENPGEYNSLMRKRLRSPEEFEARTRILQKTTTASHYMFIDDKINPKELSIDLEDKDIKYLNNFADFEELKQLSKEIYSKNKKLNFFIGNSDIKKGKIINEVYPYKQEIEVCFSWEQISKQGMPIEGLSFFDEHADKRRLKVLSSLIKEFWIYQFDSGNREYLLFSEERLELETFVIEGTILNLTDNFQVGKEKKINVNLPFLFVNKAHSQKSLFKSHDAIINKCKRLGLNEEKFFDYLFSHEDGYTYNHPRYFQYLMSAFLFSKKRGFPLHIMIIAQPGTGKSTLEEVIYDKFEEDTDIIEGSSSTIKSLIPSFKGNLPDPGAILKSNRVCIVDEFLRILLRIEKEERNIQLSSLNPLLEHRKRTAGSGNGKIKLNSTCRILSVSNPVWGTKTIDILANRFDLSWLSRWFIWYQDKEHIDQIQAGTKMKKTLFFMKKDDFLSIFDYLNGFYANFDEKRVENIHMKGRSLLGEDTEENLLRSVIEIYSARYKHHILCLMDGIIKTRCICCGDDSFTANEEDYKMLETIWMKMLVEWGIYQDSRVKNEILINGS